MSASARPAANENNWNLPNMITSVRLVVSLLVFVAMHCESYLPALILFLIAASTDGSTAISPGAGIRSPSWGGFLIRWRIRL